ncbi:GNAT domain-containing protein [Podospora didyma]|uniref:GNAT domain-containing protein n=1 Tax=Podospora didyma TaxID=330526 RepID=A0AAE0P6X1_9PEZI|nr:GNAT domain-containing protein [Podospora didyma]
MQIKDLRYTENFSLSQFTSLGFFTTSIHLPPIHSPPTTLSHIHLCVVTTTNYTEEGWPRVKGRRTVNMAAPQAEAAPNQETFVLVRTTLPRQPFPASATRPAVTTDRLILRPFSPSDLDALHVLRTQPEVMVWTGLGRADHDLAETQAKLNLYLPPNDATTFNCAICLRETGEFVGAGGCHNRTSSVGWPEVGYMFKEEVWGKGMGTEFLKGFLQMWRELPRKEVTLRVDHRTIPKSVPENGGEAKVVEEQLIAVTASENDKSQHVLKKCGFEHALTWKEKDSRDITGETFIALPTYRYLLGRSE